MTRVPASPLLGVDGWLALVASAGLSIVLLLLDLVVGRRYDADGVLVQSTAVGLVATRCCATGISGRRRRRPCGR